MRAEPSDVELLRRARRDPEAFRAVYQRYAAPLAGWLERQTGQRDVALDLTAETFACALAGLERFRAQTGASAGPWLYGIAANLLRRFFAERALETRARARLGVLADTRFAADDTLAALERLDAEAVAERLRGALASLPPAYREAIELRVVADLPYAAAAERMRCSEATARVRVHRGLRLLRLTAAPPEEAP